MAEYRRTTGLNVIDPGIGRATASMASNLQGIANIVERRENELLKQRQKEGALKGATEGYEASKSGEVPETREGKLDWLFGKSAFNEAYNQAAESAYLESTEARIGNDLAGLAADNPDNVDAFNEALGSYREGMIEGAGEYGGIVNQMIEQASVKTSAKVLANQREKGFKTISAQWASAVRDARENTLDAIRSGDDPAEAMSKYMSLQRRRLEAGAIGLTEYDNSMREFQNEVVAQGVYAAHDEAYDKGEGSAYIRELMDKGVVGYEGDPEDIYSELKTRQSRRVALEDAEEARAEKSRTATYKESEVTLLKLNVHGELTDDVLKDYALNELISPASYFKWQDKLKQQEVIESDSNTLLAIGMDVLNYSEEDILSADLTNEDKLALVRRRESLVEGWASEQWARESFRRIKNEIGLPDGDTIDAPAELVKEANEALTIYYNEIEATDPAMRSGQSFSIVDKVTKKYKLQRRVEERMTLKEKLDKMVVSEGDVMQENLKQKREKRLSELDSEIEALQQ